MNRFVLAFVAVVLVGCIHALAQLPCSAPPPVITQPGNIFSPEQESILGDIIADQVERDFRLVTDDNLNHYLQELGERLLVHLPARLKIAFRLVDIPDVNAYTLPGGHIYVTRKLVAFVQSEDELAGVLGHEIGHALGGDPAVTESAEFRTVIGVTSVGDRSDITAKYNRLLDNRARSKHEVKEDEHIQIQADRLAVYALARSGYDVESYSQVWDRLAQTKGRTGNWLSDLFGTTTSGARRLREVIKSTAAIPRECVEQPLANRGSRFSEFRKSVIEYSEAVQQASLHGVFRQVRLSPPLRPDIDVVRFSPDGKFVMAQDESGIYVLTREPFALLFRIDAPNAHAATFTPDSQSLVFSNSSLRVEKWSVAEKTRTSVHELAIQQSCAHSRLSPDGSVLVCYGTDLTLRLFEVDTGKLLVEKKNFTRLNYWELQQILGEGLQLTILSRIVFSRDGHYLIATDSHFSDLHYLAYDLSKREEIRLPHPVRKIIAHPFDFLAASRIVGGTDSNDAIVARFPSGDALQRIQLGDASPTAATHGDYVLIRPVKDHALGVLDLTRNQFVLVNDTPALDLYDDLIVGEMKSGSLALFRIGSATPVAQVALPEARLGTLRVAALSPNIEDIALSERSRSGVWELNTGRQRLRLRGLRGAWFSADGTLFADFPKDDVEKQPRNMLHIDLRTGHGSVAYRVAEGSDTEEPKDQTAQAPPKWWVYQVGELLCTWKPSVKDDTLDQNVDLEVSDITNGKPLWSRHFPKERPYLYFDLQSGELIFAWQLSTSAAKQEISGDPPLSARLAELTDRPTAVLLELLNGRTGTVIGRIIVDTGKASFQITDVEGNGDIVKVHDNQNRILFYSAATGKQIGSLFSDGLSKISADGSTLAIVNAEYELTLYSLPTLEKKDSLRFPEPISWFWFGRGSKQIFILTRDQTAYTLDLSSNPQNATATGRVAHPILGAPCNRALCD
jgi:WD40 repeat protein